MSQSAHENQRQGAIDGLIDELIHNELALSRASARAIDRENYEESKKYCDYHLRSGTYIDRTTGEIMDKDVRAMCERFEIASQGDKARALEVRARALALMGTNDRESDEWRSRDERGGKIVLMLLRLARRPLRTSLAELGLASAEDEEASERAEEEEEEEEEKETSSVASEGGEERSARSDSTLSEWSDEEQEMREYEDDGVVAERAGGVEDEDGLGFSWRYDVHGDFETPSASAAAATTAGSVKNEYQFVPDAVVQARALQSALHATNARRGGEVFLAAACAKNLPNEASLVNRILHALRMGSSDIQRVSLPHVSHATIEGALVSIRHVAEELERLQTLKFRARRCGPTIQAFAEALDKQARVLKRVLTPLEMRLSRDYNGNEGKPTLLELRTTVRLFQSNVDALDRAAQLAFPVEDCTAAKAASHCLSALHDLVSEYQAAADVDGFVLILRIFVDAVQPYLDGLHRWLASGSLEDPSGELFIAEGPAVREKVGSKENWVRGYDLRHGDETPRFLIDLATNILDVGRSLKLLHCAETQNLQIPRFDSSLGVLFCDSVRDMLRATTTIEPIKSDSNVSVVEQPVAPTMSKSFMDSFGPSSLIGICGVPADVMMNNIISKPTRVVSVRESSSKSKLQSSSDALEAWLDEFLRTQIPACPMSLLIQKSLSSHIDRRAKEVQLALVDRIRNVWFVKKELNALRVVFLGGAGDAASHFFSAIFAILDDPENIKAKWNDITLNELLVDALSVDTLYRAAEGRNVQIEIIPEAEQNIFSQVVIGTGSLEKIASLRYSFDVHWPHSVVISPSAVAQYNEITVFLTQLRRASYCMQSVGTARWTKHIRRASGNGLGGPIARKFEPRLRYFISSLYTHVLVRILDTAWEELIESIDRAMTLDDMRSAHDAFLNVASRQCLVSPDPTWTLLAEQIRTILAVACEYAACQLDDGSIGEGDASRLSATFEDAHEYILRVLTSKLNYGSADPDVEDLLVALSII